MSVWRGKRVLVTGAYGFLASHLIEDLLAAAAIVTGLVRDRPAESYLQMQGLDSRITLAPGDLTDFGAVKRALLEEEIEVVFHLAAQAIVGLANRSPLSTFEFNIRGTYLLLEACRELRQDSAPLRAVVVASSDKAYGDQATLPYTEEAPLQGLHPYDASKSCCDLLTRAVAKTYGLPAAVTRCANLYGPGDLNLSRIVPATIQSLLRGDRPVIRSDGSPQRDYLFVKDCVAGYLALAAALLEGRAVGQAYNLGTGRPVTVLELVNEIIGVVGVDLKPDVQSTADAEILHQYLDASLAREDLGWVAATSLREGLQASHRWYKEYAYKLMADIELTIVMPVYNERPTVLEILRRVRELPVTKEVIIVDNCSTDGTREVLQGLEYSDVKVVLQPQNMMKGNSVKRGIGLAQGEYVVVQDGDLEYEPTDLLQLLTVAKQEDVLAVIGSRLLGAKERGETIPRTVFRLGGDFVNWVFQVMYRSPLTDIASCYKMAPRSVLHRLDLRCDGFDLDFETAAKFQLLARRENKRVVEIPIHYAPRTTAQGKKINWRDGLRALATLWRTRFWKPGR